MSFWDNFADDITTSEIDALFVRDEPCTLSELLMKDTLIQETVGFNTYVIEFFSKQEVIVELFQVVLYPPETKDSDEARTYRMPYIGSQVLTCGISQLWKRFWEDVTITNKMFDYLKQDEGFVRENQLYASYFCTIFMFLFENQQSELAAYLEEKAEFFTANTMRLLEAYPLLSMCLKLLDKCERDDDVRAVIQKIIEKGDIIKHLVHNFTSKARNVELIKHTSELLVRIVNVFGGTSSLVNKLKSDPCIQPILSAMQEDESCLEHGLPVILELLKLFHNHSNPSAFPDFIKITLSSVPQFLERLQQPHKTKLQHPTLPLGATRLEIVKVLDGLIKCNYEASDKLLREYNTIEVVLDLFFKYPMNNFLHTCVVSVVHSSLLSTTLQPNLFDSHLCERLINSVPEEGSYKLGYTGHVWKIASFILEQNIADKYLSGTELENWNTFARDQVQVMVNEQLQPLYVEKPLNSAVTKGISLSNLDDVDGLDESPTTHIQDQANPTTGSDSSNTATSGSADLEQSGASTEIRPSPEELEQVESAVNQTGNSTETENSNSNNENSSKPQPPEPAMVDDAIQATFAAFSLNTFTPNLFNLQVNADNTAPPDVTQPTQPTKPTTQPTEAALQPSETLKPSTETQDFEADFDSFFEERTTGFQEQPEPNNAPSLGTLGQTQSTDEFDDFFADRVTPKETKPVESTVHVDDFDAFFEERTTVGNSQPSTNVSSSTATTTATTSATATATATATSNFADEDFFTARSQMTTAESSKSAAPTSAPSESWAAF